MTGRGNPVLRIRVNGERIAVPIQMDGAYERFRRHFDDGWGLSQFRVTIKETGWIAYVSIRKDVPPIKTSGTVGIDIGSGTLAAVSMTDDVGDPVRQLYLGQDIAAVQQQILLRRSRLQSRADKGSRRAQNALKRLRGYEGDFTQTRCYQVAHEVVAIAVEHHRSISVENLNHLRDARLHRGANRSGKRLPYREFRAALESVAGQAGIPVVVVPAKNTSRTCPRCGTISKDNRRGRLFRCVSCGFTANADRTASLNIARRGLSLERDKANGIPTNAFASAQDSSDGGRVNDPVRNHEGCVGSCSQHVHLPEFKPPISMGGS